jgi:hypothetical protein
MRRTQIVVSAIVFFGMTAAATAAVTNVPLDVGSWVKDPYLTSIGWQTPDATVTNPPGGNLRGTKTTATGGTAWSLGIHTSAEYNFQNATLRYQWKQNALGQWSGHYNGLDSDTAPLLYGRGYVTGNDPSFTIIPSDTWLYTQIVMANSTYDISVSTSGYGGTNIWHAAGALAPATWTALATAHPFFQIGDNYAAGAYFELAAVSIISGPPALQSAVSRKVHGAAGTYDLTLSQVALNPTTEPRQSSTATIVMTFDVPVISADIAITEGTATAGAPTFNGNDVIVPLTGVVDRQYVTITASNVASALNTGGSGSIRIGFLVGDVNQSRVVSVADLGLVNAQLSQVVTAANFLKDVNATGTLTVADKGITNANLTQNLPPP